MVQTGVYKYFSGFR